MGSCGANRREFKAQSAIKGNLGQKNAFLVAKQGLMGIRPNKKKKKKKKKKGMEIMFLYRNHVFVWKLGFCMVVFVWRLVVPFLGFR